MDGVVYSTGDKTVDEDTAKKYFPDAVPAIRGDGDYPAHVNMREEGRKFGQMKASASSEMGEDAKAYVQALGILAKDK